MEPDKLEQNIVLKDWCTDFVLCDWNLFSLQGQIFLWCQANDCSWNHSLALHPQWQAINSLQFQAMHSLQFHTLNIPPQQHRPWCTAFLSNATCINAACTASSSRISCSMKNQVNWKKIDWSAQFWNFCIQDTWCRGKLLHQKELVDSFDENKKNEGPEIGTCHAACLQRQKRSFPSI